MPNYNYECSSCGHTLQEFQTMSEKALLLCPKCKKKKLVRLISGGSAVIFKGTGFYETDYKKKPNSEPKSTAPAATTSSETPKTESKTEATPSKPAESTSKTE